MASRPWGSKATWKHGCCMERRERGWEPVAQPKWELEQKLLIIFSLSIEDGVMAKKAEKAKTAKKTKKAAKRKYSKSAATEVERELHRAKKGTAKSGSGGKGGRVKSKKQAIAIGLSKARKKGANVPKKKS